MVSLSCLVVHSSLNSQYITKRQKNQSYKKGCFDKRRHIIFRSLCFHAVILWLPYVGKINTSLSRLIPPLISSAFFSRHFLHKLLVRIWKDNFLWKKFLRKIIPPQFHFSLQVPRPSRTEIDGSYTRKVSLMLVKIVHEILTTAAFLALGQIQKMNYLTRTLQDIV